MGTYASYPIIGGSSAPGSLPSYGSIGLFPSPGSVGNGALGIALDTNILYESDGAQWFPIAGPGVVLSIGTFDSGTASSNGAHIDSGALVMQSASATNPGLVNISTQIWAGVKTFNAAPIMNSLSASTAVVLDGSKSLSSLAYGSTNSFGTLVQRDGSGNFTATTITANLTGTASGNPPNARTITTTAPLTGGGDLSANRVFAITQATTSTDGYLSSVDWNTFNGKQPAGNYITSLTGAITASGPGAAAVSITAQTGTGTTFVMQASPTLTTPNIGTPSAGVLTSCTGLPISTGVSGLGTGVATFLATPSSANLAAAVTDETGTGVLVFATSPTLVTPNIGVATATTVNKVTITAPTTSATLTIADGKTFVASNSLTLTGVDGNSFAFPSGSSTVMTLASTDTVTGAKTFVNGISFTNTADSSTFRYYSRGTTVTNFTFNGTGGGTTSNVTLIYERIGDFVYLYLPAATTGSGTGSVFMGSGTAIPAAYRPLTINQYIPCWNQNAGSPSSSVGLLQVNTSGNIYFYRDGTAASAYTNTTTCGNPYAQTVVYYVGTGS